MPIEPNSPPVAIVGVGVRFPGQCNSLAALWDLVSSQRDIARDIDRFNLNGNYFADRNRPYTTNVKQAYLLEQDPAYFDASFFSIGPKEAEAMDPQQRMLLEVAFEALQDGGFDIEALRNSETGSYVGTFTSDYADMLSKDLREAPKYMAIGTGRSMISAKLNHFYDWHGPAVTIDTACSSSLVACDMAVKALRSGDISMALVAGSNLILSPDMFITESTIGMVSPDSRSRMWDESANGYARGEGVAAILLKRLDMVDPADKVTAIIRETGTNQDGRTPGITMPNASAQENLIRSTYKKAGLHPKDTQYFEAHGTGTKAGDPVEATAIRNVFGNSRQTDEPLYVGSIKSHIGHLEGAAGLAGLLNIVSAMSKGFMPLNCNFKKLNPQINTGENIRISTSRSLYRQFMCTPHDLRAPTRSPHDFGWRRLRLVAPRVTESQSDEWLVAPRVTESQ